MGDESDEVPLPHTTETDGTTFPFANLDADEPSIERESMAGDESLLETALPSPVMVSWVTEIEGQITLPATGETAREIVSLTADRERLMRLLEEVRRDIASARQAVSATPELAPITAQDAEAIANAYLEDDLSDEERGRSLENIDDPAVTMEEADIDRTLWRLHVD
jgi:hypothetical protein